VELRAAGVEQLTVDLDARGRGEAEGERGPPNGADGTDRQVVPGHHRLEEKQAADRRDVIDGDEVDHPVIGARPGSDRKPPAVAEAVGEDREEDGTEPESIARVELDGLVAEDLLQRGEAIAERAANDALDPTDSLQRLEDPDVEAEAGDVQRVPAVDPQRVDRSVRSLGGKPGERDPRARLAAERGDEVVAGAPGEEHGATARPRPRGDDRPGRLAPRPVAAEDGDRVGAGIERAADAAHLVARTLREDRLADADTVEGAPNGME
jgi:hypothetical protein